MIFLLPNTLKPIEFRSYLHVLFSHVACIKPEILNKLKLKLGVEQILFTVVHFVNDRNSKSLSRFWPKKRL